MKNEWKELAEKLLFDFGKAVLGKNAGGMIVKLMRDRGIDGARNAIRAASEKSDPKEYIGAAIRQKDGSGVQIGEEIRGYVWTGSRWTEKQERAQ